MAFQTDVVNGNSSLSARFHKKAVKQEFESEKQGREIYADVDYVEICVPGDVLTVLDQAVREDHKRRFAQQWAYYQNNINGDSREVGTPLTEWPRMTPAMIEELKALKFFSVESIASAADSNLQRIQMIAGMSPFALRDHATRFLKLAADDSAMLEQDTRAKKLEDELAEMKQQMAELIAAQGKKTLTVPKKE